MSAAAFHQPDPDDEAAQQLAAHELLVAQAIAGTEFEVAQLAAIRGQRHAPPRHTPDSDRTPAAEPLDLADPDPEC